MQGSLRLAALVLALAALARGQVVPQGIYYKFNEGSGTTVANQASPGVGNAFGNIIGSLSWGAGKFGGGLVGTGLPGNANYIDTGYAMNLNGVSWTIEFWWATPPSGPTQYVCGSNTSNGSFRIFSSSTPGLNVVLSGAGLTTTVLGGVVPPPGGFVHIAYVFDASTSTMLGYANGVLGVTVAQAGTPVLNTGTFVVGAQSTQPGLAGTLDEFRLWLTAPIGTGPVLGIWPDALTWSVVAAPVAVGNPLHFYTGHPGFYPSVPFGVPPGLPLSAFSGQAFDFAAVLFAPGFVYVGKSTVSRLTW